MNIDSDYLVEEYGVRLPNDLPLVLRSLRHQKGLSQQQVADMLGISQKTMSSLERKADMANFTRLVKLLELLDAEFVIRPRS
jgi:transcriptional regulator with XRE-family HTH domain